MLMVTTALCRTVIGRDCCETLVRVGNAGINKAQLIGQGLDPTVVDNLFKNPMTLRMNVTLTAQLVTDASLTCNMRLFGD